jgi:starch phosphorylase
MVLGICGWRLLRTLGIHPEVCHLNEGHAAFAVLERARAYMEDHNQPFDVALAATRAGNLFTTHTPVEAGFDRFQPDLMTTYFERYARERLKISLHELMALGRSNPDDPNEPFNMAYLGIRGSGAVNAVSRLHGEVSRKLFQGLFTRWPRVEVPVGSVTNGIHTPTWDSAEADELWTRYCGRDRWRGSQESIDEQMRRAADEDLWNLRTSERRSLVQFARRRVALQRAWQNAAQSEIDAAQSILDENHLTIGFARRFATYKRPDLLLHDPERLAQILTNRERPVQLIIAGKAHPQDTAGQDMIRRWSDFMRRGDIRGRAVFLTDYDALLAYQFVTGMDVWINTPRRPWEACGTSGMKVLANGGLNVSELDGWWAEAYSPNAGWAIGDGKEHDGDTAWDTADAENLYRVLEEDVIPSFYDRDQRGIPVRWVAKMRQSIASLATAFSANRAVRQYTEQHYVPLAAAFCERSGDAIGLSSWIAHMRSKWDDVRFGGVTVQSTNAEYRFQAEVHLGAISPGEVAVEIYADPLNSEAPIREPMILHAAAADTAMPHSYTGAVSARRPVEDFTLRVIPHRKGVLVPLELSLVLWQH